MKQCRSKNTVLMSNSTVSKDYYLNITGGKLNNSLRQLTNNNLFLFSVLQKYLLLNHYSLRMCRKTRNIS